MRLRTGTGARHTQLKTRWRTLGFQPKDHLVWAGRSLCSGIALQWSGMVAVTLGEESLKLVTELADHFERARALVFAEFQKMGRAATVSVTRLHVITNEEKVLERLAKWSKALKHNCYDCEGLREVTIRCASDLADAL